MRRVEDLLKDDQSTRKLEQETGMSRQQIEQFVDKWKKAPDRPAPGPGRTIEAKPGKDPPGPRPRRSRAGRGSRRPGPSHHSAH